MSSERWSEKAVAGILPIVVYSIAQLTPNLAEAASATAVLGGTHSIGQVGSVSINGSRVTFQGRISNYCGAPDSQRWVIPCAHNGLEITLSGLPNGNVSNAVLALTVFGDHDSDPLPEDAEYINIHIDNTYLGRIFDGNPGNDRFNFSPHWPDHGNLMSSPVSSSAQMSSSELSTALADGTIRIRLGFEGQSHDDYSPWLLHGTGRADYQEYMDFTFSYDIAGTPIYDQILNDTDDNAPDNGWTDNTGGGDSSAPISSPEPLQDGQIGVYPSADVGATLSSSSPTLYVSQWDHGFVKFDLAAALSNLNANDIANARFQINEQSADASNGLMVWRNANTNWAEGSGIPAETGYDTNSGEYLGKGASVDITALAQAALTNNGIVSLELSHESGSWIPFFSRESSQPPVIVITPTPGNQDNGSSSGGGSEPDNSNTDNTDVTTPDDATNSDSPTPAEPTQPVSGNQLQIFPSEDLGATGQGSNPLLYVSQWDHAFVRFNLNNSISNLSASDVVRATFTVSPAATNMPEGIAVWESEERNWQETDGQKVKTYQSNGTGVLMGEGTSVDITPLVQAALSSNGIVDLELTHISGGWQSYDSREGNVPPSIIIETGDGSGSVTTPADDAETPSNDGGSNSDSGGNTSAPSINGEQTVTAISDIGANRQADSGTLHISRWDRAFVRFETAPVDVSRVLLRVYQQTSRNLELSVHEAEKADWEEHGSIPARTAAPYGNARWIGSTAVSGSGWTAIDISDYAVGRLRNGEAISLELLTDQGGWLNFGSSESSTPPELVLIP